MNELVYFEETQDVKTAIEREKEIKKWRGKRFLATLEMTSEWFGMTGRGFRMIGRRTK